MGPRIIKRGSARAALLEAALQQFHLRGFQGTGLNDIMAGAGVTKGSLYHHFSSKTELGYAVLDEIVGPWAIAHWVEPLKESESAVDGVLRVLHTTTTTDLQPIGSYSVTLERGCMLLNLSQEMSPLDSGFRTRIKAIFDTWRRTIALMLARDQGAGRVRGDIDPEAAATFIVASLEGALSLTKNAQDQGLLEQCTQELGRYVTSLRAPQ
ncbi:MAG: TetR family transcriptional regulator [Myxococcota bacterium]